MLHAYRSCSVTCGLVAQLDQVSDSEVWHVVPVHLAVGQPLGDAAVDVDVVLVGLVGPSSLARHTRRRETNPRTNQSETGQRPRT
jgi:hypothetical protein